MRDPTHHTSGRGALFALLLAACTARHGQGEQCAFNDDCASPLVCAARRCRLACRTDRDCLNETVCRPSGDFALWICQLPSDPWRCASQEDCAPPSVCGPTGQCQLPCRVDYDCRFASYQARCAEGVCAARDAGAVGDGDDATAPRDVPDDVAEPARDDAAIADAQDVAAPADARGDGGGAEIDASDAAAAMDAGADVRGDVVRPPTFSFVDVLPVDAPPPPRLRGVFARLRVCAIREDGATLCWGPNPSGALGLGADAGTTVTAPTEVAALRGAVEIAHEVGSTCARMGDGTVRCAGRNGTGALGDGTTTSRPTFAPVVGVSGAVSLRAGDTGYCALLGGGALRCWGLNNLGQIGDGTSGNYRATPVSPRGLTGVAEVAMGDSHACARLMDGTVRCWGGNLSGQLGNGSTAVSNAPVVVTGLTDVVQIALGYNTSCALKRDGTAWCWGANTFGLLGDGTFTDRSTPVQVMNAPADVRSIETSGRATCFVHGSARVASCFGMQPLGGGVASSSGSTRTLQRVRDLENTERLIALSHNISTPCYTALRADGTAIVWGTVGEGVLGPRPVSVGIPLAVQALVPP